MISKTRLWWSTHTKQTKGKRRHLTPEFNARIAIEALQGIKTINEIAQANELAPTQVSPWKNELEGRVPEIFADKNHAKSELAIKEKHEQRLEQKVGQFVIEKEFLEKKCEELGLDLSEKP